MTPYYATAAVTLYHGDALDVLRDLPDDSVHAVVTDPPYGLGFMGAKWDTYANELGRAKSTRHKFDHVGGNHNPTNSADAARTRRVEAQRFGDWCAEWVAECLRALKPGGHLLAFGGTRTSHRLACAVEDAGFEIRDSIAWLYGSGFPKSLDVGKAIDKAAGAERDVAIGGSDGAVRAPRAMAPGGGVRTAVQTLSTPATPDAERWQGWGTALKPAFEPIVVARKPLVGTVAGNVLVHGTGALNIDACRVGTDVNTVRSKGRNPEASGAFPHSDDGWQPHLTHAGSETGGRWPANVVLDQHQAAELDRQSGTLTSGGGDRRSPGERYGRQWGDGDSRIHAADSGGASRFFYCAKADAGERPRINDIAHPTIKPLDLMRFLVRLVTPPGGVVLEPFAGSGTTAEACLLEGFRCIAVEQEADYLPLIVNRLTRRTDPVAYLAAIRTDTDTPDLFTGVDDEAAS